MYHWATEPKFTIRTETRVIEPSPGYHKWDRGELDALMYAVEKLPVTTTLSEFVNAIVPGEDCRDSVVTLLATTSGGKVDATSMAAKQGAKAK